MWWLVLNEAAKQFVASKLTTHWGGPKETLAALEQALLRVARQPPGAVKQAVHRQGLCLLHFVLILEQTLKNALIGSASRVALPKSAATYCYGNAASCRQWLARLRPAATAAAKALGAHRFVICFGLAHLESLKLRAERLFLQIGNLGKHSEASNPAKKIVLQRGESNAVESQSPAAALLAGAAKQQSSGDGGSHGQSSPLPSLNPRQALQISITEVTACLAVSLRQLHEPDALEGLAATYREAMQACGKEWTVAEQAVLRALGHQAAGRHENALAELSSVSVDSDKSTFGFRELMLAAQAESYAAVNDWELLQQWIKVSRTMP